MHTNNNLELIERINEQLETANARGSAYSSIAWSYASSFLNAILGLYNETNPERIAKLEARSAELAAITGWANSLALADYRPDADQLIERIGKTAMVIDEDTLLEAKATASGLDKETLKLALELNAQQEAERAALHARVYELHENAIRLRLEYALYSPMDASFQLSDRDALRIVERLSEKAKAAKDRALMQVIRARTIMQITRAAAESKLLDSIIPQLDALYHRLSAQLEAQTERAPIEEQTAELTGTDDAHQTPKRWNKRKIA